MFLIILIIAATRMHRSLVNFASGSTEYDSLFTSFLFFSLLSATDVVLVGYMGVHK
jgi:hypothetical protein